MSTGRDFWSRRRAGVEAEEQVLEARVAEAEVAKLEERPDEELLAELNLPEPEDLDSPDAVRDFLQAELPQRLKTRALRRLWRLNPIFANLDGLVDYGEDYTDAAMVIENMQTVYQVGKGMVTAFLDDEEDEAEAVDEVPAEEVEQIEVEEEEAPLIAEAEPVPLPDPEPEPTAMPQRRMRFAFDTA
ncbi:hypothetical protein GCM10007385_45960 [Tateyamaria omphalii]|uniref:DUF3306 domain-containing protein n=1 Tax=Tateyamaria omphalii TaxID=299262 RepID=UPI001672CB61|nr:DUF3306 domain-containing protein [Tateyamaria omphalii]GGX71840.1 hypothetical protein GCM10007385_45960 [Tateyamaria omphalii]